MANGVATFYDGASAYNIPDNVRAWTGTVDYAGGALTGVENIYVMRGGEFVWANSGTLPSGKAYLVYDASQAQAAATRLWLNFGGEELGIAAIETLAEKQSLYNLQGQKINVQQRGQILVRDGKKAIVR